MQTVGDAFKALASFVDIALLEIFLQDLSDEHGPQKHSLCPLLDRSQDVVWDAASGWPQLAPDVAGDILLVFVLVIEIKVLTSFEFDVGIVPAGEAYPKTDRSGHD